MIIRGIFILSLLHLSIGTATGQINSARFPYVAEITGDNVNIRAGADLNFEVICQAQMGDKVTVYKRNRDWYAIEPPPGCSFYVAKEYISKVNSRGLIRVDDLNVRAGPGANYSILGQINRNDSVNIVGVKGKWYKIKPPSKFRVWINGAYLKYYSSLKDYILEQKTRSKVKKEFENLERLYYMELSKHLSDMRLEGLLKGYNRILVNYPNSEYTEKCQSRIATLELKLSELMHFKARESLDKAKRGYEKKIKNLKKKLPSPDASGIVGQLGVIINRPGTHKLLKDGILSHYLKSDRHNLNKFVGKEVLIWGNIVTVSGWRYPLIKVERIRPFLLKEQEGLSFRIKVKE